MLQLKWQDETSGSGVSYLLLRRYVRAVDAPVACTVDLRVAVLQAALLPVSLR